ncbi:MAG: hypothetical protein A2X36_15390 [Elusimicrobia bacterium GWA2_69_24]|nr:MAG: hypothetical protein A2X36_15390 [Elusimicrobia bacterium GWA2_69_24]HBL18345.1 ribosome maturation factor RimP [Elusimicrobiota bacterium]
MSFDLNIIEKSVGDMLALEGVELVDLRFLQEHGRWVLRFFLDKHAGITIDDCERLSDRIGSFLDAEDAIPHAYCLEVSSPGLDRVLKKAKDFERFAGHPVKVRLKASPEGGRRRFTGYLKGLEDGKVVVENGPDSVRLELAAIEEARLNPDVKV